MVVVGWDGNAGFDKIAIVSDIREIVSAGLAASSRNALVHLDYVFLVGRKTSI